MPIKSYGNLQIDSDFLPGLEPAPSQGIPVEAGGGSLTIMITAVCAAGFGCALACLASWIWVRTGRKQREDSQKAIDAVKDLESGRYEDIDGDFVLDKHGSCGYYHDEAGGRPEDGSNRRHTGPRRADSLVSFHITLAKPDALCLIPSSRSRVRFDAVEVPWDLF